MTTNTSMNVHFDPYDASLTVDPYPTYKRLRDEAPLYRNDQYDFFALSRFADVEKGLREHETFSSARGNVLEVIKAGMEIPSGLIVMDDPPRQTIHRKLLSRMFTPRKIAQLEPMIRGYCVRSLDALVGAGGFDFVADLGAQMPMRVIGMLLGIPEERQEVGRDRVYATVNAQSGSGMSLPTAGFLDDEFIEEYVDWRAENPSDDIVTELLNVEFEDETGTRRRLDRAEILAYVALLQVAGNETTTKLIGWAGKILAENPDQRAQLVANPSLIPDAVEEILRLETPAPRVARYVTRDVEYYDQIVPQGSIMMFLIGAANHDHRQFPPDGDSFDIHRRGRTHISFAAGAHFCLGAALARLEGRIALEELLIRFPEWDIDLSKAVMSPSSTVRGWETMPAIIPT
ncbi:cytochrome P450 [Mycobacterium intermedium]|uniref:Cytochrome P450 n=1 Tax=Mycobacterium intermedium TaxID=28445 RepID=A0A1E3SBY4_MYCIE|nr:cytochrome P450 [Mycobacterium intermedium]MCV6966885.1 cytochrome P450 [Mycobacterium intermedium]ODQ99670.1 cytochrome [Mycobacterium intermedium]OPE49043.1 cytochrome P450 [Mycobacterium intermedium]ORB07176.1 cytochrome P450 [Mycobacterium intermedium]